MGLSAVVAVVEREHQPVAPGPFADDGRLPEPEIFLDGRGGGGCAPTTGTTVIDGRSTSLKSSRIGSPAAAPISEIRTASSKLSEPDTA